MDELNVTLSEVEVALVCCAIKEMVEFIKHTKGRLSSSPEDIALTISVADSVLAKLTLSKGQ